MPELEPFRTSWMRARIGAKLFVDEQRAFINIFCLAEVILLLIHRAGQRTAYLDRRTTEFIRFTTKMYSHLNANRDFDTSHPGLRTILFQTLCRLGNPEKIVHGLVSVSGRTMSVYDFACAVHFL